MALVDTVWYCNSVGYAAVTVRPQNTAVAAGVLRRQFTAPAVGNERVFVCIAAGTTANVTDATWVLTRGAKTTDGTATWMECTGQAGLSGDLTNATTWAAVKAATPAVLGQVIKRSNNASYQICTTAGAMSASEPAFSDTAGVTTTDTTAVWTSLGPVSNFTGGQAPHARLASACTSTWFAAGNTVYVGDNHAESQATTLTINPAGTTSTIARIVCHNHSGSYPPASGDLATGATVTATGAVNFSIAAGLTGGVYIYGLTLQAGSGSNNAFLIFGSVTQGIVLDNCSLQLTNTNAGAVIQLGGAGGYTIATLVNTTVKFGNIAQTISVFPGVHNWKGGELAAGSSVPTNLFNLNTTNASPHLVVEAVDLSAVTGLVVFNQSTAGNFLFKDCKLNAAATSATPTTTGAVIQLVRSDSAATAYKSARYAYEGTETTETSIVRVGGATDPAGQVQSRKIVTTANNQWVRPFKAEPYAVWNAVTGANVTVTVCGTINAGALPNNDDIWLEVEYLGSSATPLGTTVSTTKASILAASAAVAPDASAWLGGGSGAGWSPFKLTATLSSPQPGQAGYLHARVRIGKASTTCYIDPQIILS